jgi:hypothetical protein
MYMEVTPRVVAMSLCAVALAGCAIRSDLMTPVAGNATALRPEAD